MLKNYFKIAIRNLVKRKLFSVINLTGLAIGLASFLLICLYVVDELSYDKFFKNSSRIYRINTDIVFGANTLHIAQTSDMMGALLKKDYPEIEGYTRIYANTGSKLIKKGTEYINEFKVAHFDSTFFNIFSFQAIAGNPMHALDEPNSVVLSKSAAIKYFGNTNIIGKTIETNDNTPVYNVTAVVDDLPKNAHFHFDFFFSMKNVNYQWGKITNHNFYTYLLLKPGADESSFKRKLDEYIGRYVLPEAKVFMKINSIEDFKKAGNSIDYSLIPLTKIHLHSDRSSELSPTGNIRYVYIFSAVALFILLIACINFMNLTTARSVDRAKEVGIRKVLGTERRLLIMQFLTESTVIVLFSTVVALILTYLILPSFNSLAGKSIIFTDIFSPISFSLLITLPIIVGLLAGSYPAFFLSSFKPIAIFKGTVTKSKGGLRSALVVFQFTTSIILIIGTLVIFKQLNFIRTKDVGFKKDQVLIINDSYALKENINSFKNDILQLPGVISGTLSSYLPVSNSSRSDNTYAKDPVMNSKNGLGIQTWRVDYDYVKTMGMQISKGRNFDRDFGSDSSAVVINETTANFLGYQDPIGQKLYRIGEDPQTVKAYTIIGVVRNFNFESLRQSIGPVALFLGKRSGLASFKINSGNIPSLIDAIASKWRSLASGMPFSYRFLDDSFNEMYESEQRVGVIALVFSMMAILIASLGLFALATFVAEQRTKEIGIRKVLGASVSGLVSLLTKDFLKLVLLAFIVAAPIGWYFMHQWLQDFEYRIEIKWTIFLSALLLATFVAITTIGFQAVRAALSNPVKSLRSE